MFSRQHYIKVANTIKKLKADYPVKSEVAAEFAALFAEDNPRFDDKRFYSAWSGIKILEPPKKGK